MRCQTLCLCHLVAELPILRTVLACLVACLCTWHGEGAGLSCKLVNESWRVLKIKRSFTNYFLARTYSEVNGSSFQGKDKKAGWKKKGVWASSVQGWVHFNRLHPPGSQKPICCLHATVVFTPCIGTGNRHFQEISPVQPHFLPSHPIPFQQALPWGSACLPLLSLGSV